MSVNQTFASGDHEPDIPPSHDTTVVGSPSSSVLNRPSTHGPKSSFLDVPSFRPSLDSTFSELSELSFHSGELLSGNTYHPRSATAAGPSLRSRLRAHWESFWATNYGAALVLLAQAFGAGMNISTQLLETKGAHGEPMHPFQILFVRQSITAILCTSWGFYSKSIPHFPFGPRGIRWLLAVRGLTGFFGIFGMYFSLLYLPLSEATVLTFLTPILTCYLCSFVIPGETFSRRQQLAGLVSLVGVIFIARPTSFLSSPTTTPPPPDPSFTNSTSNSTAPATGPSRHPTSEQHLAAIGIAMLGVLGSVGALTSIRAIGTRVHALISINYFSIWCTIVSLACLVVFPNVKFRLPGNLIEWSLLANLGLCGFIMQFLLTAGLAYGGPAAEPKNQQGDQASGRQKFRDLESTDPEVLRDHTSDSIPPDPNGTSSTTKKPKAKASGTRATAMLYVQMLFALAGDKLVFGVTLGTMSWIGSALILTGAIWVASARESAGSSSKGPTGDNAAGGDEASVAPSGDVEFTVLSQRSIRNDSGKDGADHEEVIRLMTGHGEEDDGDDGTEYNDHDHDGR